MKFNNSNLSQNNDRNQLPAEVTGKKEKLTKWLIRLNVVAVSVLLCLLILMIYDKTRNQKTVAEETVVSEDVVVEKKLDDSMSTLYQSLLEGWTYRIDEDIIFSFGRDNLYSGFFDKDNRDVQKYSYEIAMDEDSGGHVLNIYNENKSCMVSYEISLDSDGNILLGYPGTDKSFVLKTDKAEVLAD
jgi:hypothetical protein